MTMEKVQLQVVTWNSESCIRDFLQSVFSQTVMPFRIVVIDNNSSDKTKKICREFPKVQVIELSTNTGFAFAHNRGIEIGLDCEAILICNPDVLLATDAIARLETYIKERPEVGTWSPTLIRNALTDDSDYCIVDAAGIRKTLTYRFLNRFEGKKIHKSEIRESLVFANTGACMCMRVEALKQIESISQITGEKQFFDDYFFAYKEEIDLCWRMSTYGWKHLVTPILSRHIRTFQRTMKRNKKNAVLVFLSYRNHLLTLKKNFSFIRHPINGLAILLFETAKFSYYLFVQPHMLIKAWKHVLWVSKYNRIT